ncbi:hypothetical protein BC332_25609 [Capsicum chinense]|nr:hypothetical protein BC332_25609 [Capsicum chinense]
MFSNSSDLKVLDLGDNYFSGSISKWLGSSLEITTLLLKENHLQGTISTEICRVSKLKIMDLSHNNPSRPIPHCIRNMMQLIGAREAYPYGPRFYFPVFQTWGRDAVAYVEDSMMRSTIHFQVKYAWVWSIFQTWGRDAVAYVEDSMMRSTIHFQVNYAWVWSIFQTWGRDAVAYVEDSMMRSTIHFQVKYAWVWSIFQTWGRDAVAYVEDSMMRASILVVERSELLKSLLTEDKSRIHVIPVFISVDPERDTAEQFVLYKSFGFDNTIKEDQRAFNAAHVEAQSAENNIGLAKLMGLYSGNMILLNFDT